MSRLAYNPCKKQLILAYAPLFGPFLNSPDTETQTVIELYAAFQISDQQ